MGNKKKASECIRCGRAHNQEGAHCSICLPEGIQVCAHCGKPTPREVYCETCEAHGYLNSIHAEKSELADRYYIHEQICKELNKVYVDKNTAYGNSFGKTYKELGIISAVTRMEDKMYRIKALVTGAENRVNDEKLEDTLKDLANYAMMTLIEMGYNPNDK